VGGAGRLRRRPAPRGDPGYRQRAAPPGEDLPAPVARRRYRRLLLRGGRGHRGRVAADVRRGAGQAGRLACGFLLRSLGGRAQVLRHAGRPRSGPADHRRISLPGKGQSGAALPAAARDRSPRSFARRRKPRAHPAVRHGHVGDGRPAGGQRAPARPGWPGDDHQAVRLPGRGQVLERQRSRARREPARDRRRHAGLPPPVRP